MTGVQSAEIEEVDAYLAELKRLDGPPPVWRPSTFSGEYDAQWAIYDSLGIQRSHLRFRVGQMRQYPSISLIFKGNSIWRFDICPPNECKTNPQDAGRKCGLPFEVCGSHCHSWDDNRAYIQRVGWGSMPYRRPTSPQMRRLSQALPWFCDAVGITLDHFQRDFDVPQAAHLFEIDNGSVQ
ncbi:hypothetical protein [Xanthobacter tagetidis]|uniref:hypothetical protein n=1 Tax=Xanthobacter tagetidis TaxID=60216 RepID=UPI0011C3F261|nr:hypothetical protein [Xanthobacter tagetidis]MBB6308318.1 hypothetical protein [Xanthobacter tagetidis]